MNERRHAELLIVRLRWLVLIAGVFMLDGSVLTLVSMGCIVVVFAYNAAAAWITGSKELFVRFGYITALVTRALDLIAITLATHWGGVGTESLYLLYGFVIVGTGYAYNRLKPTLVVLAACIALDLLAMRILGLTFSIITHHTASYLAATLVAVYIIAFRKQDESMRMKERKLSALFEYGTRFTSRQDLDQLLEQVLDTAMAETGATTGCISLLDSKGQLVRKTCKNRDGKEHDCSNEEIVKTVVSTGQPIMVVPGAAEASQAGNSGRQVICVPLVDKTTGNAGHDTPYSRIVGTLTVESSQHPAVFGQEDLELVRTLAIFASMGVVNARLYNNLHDNFVKTLQSLARSLEARDPYTQGHSHRVSEIAQLVGQELKLPPEGIAILKNAALLHDIGKIGVPDAILQKPGTLTTEERLVIQTHPTTGENICRPLNLGDEALFLIRHHQERLNGTGYPDELPADQQPLPLRILCAVDALDAMSSDRPYRNALSAAERVEQLNRGAGTDFDPIVVEVLKSLLSSGSLDRFYAEPGEDEMPKAA